MLDPEDAVVSSIPQACSSLSRWQIFWLCFARLMETSTFFAPFPYIPQMLQEIEGLKDADLGFYTGTVESSSEIVELAVLVVWYYLADRIGRKATLILSLAGMSIGPIFFGFSRSFAQMIVFRCVTSLFSGASLIVRTMIGENSSSKRQAEAYGWFSVADVLGYCVGPIIGGFLAEPGALYPGLFAHVGFFQIYPYALPGFVVGALNLLTALACALSLDGTPQRKTSLNSHEATQSKEKLTRWTAFWHLYRQPKVSLSLLAWSQSVLLGSYFIAIVPLALYTPINAGGLSFNAPQISLYLGAQAAGQSVWLILAFPRLSRRCGPTGILQSCAVLYPILFASFIAMNALLRDGGASALAVFWVVTCISTLLGPYVFTSFAASQLIINSVSTDAKLLGSINFIALLICKMIRMILPALATAAYGFGIKSQLWGGYFGWIVVMPVSSGLLMSARFLGVQAGSVF